MHQNLFHRMLEQEVVRHGGLFNAHGHVDRFATLDLLGDSRARDIGPGRHPLWNKADVTQMLHNSIAYTRSSLSERIHRFIAESEMCGVTRVDSFVDVTTDVPLAGGLGALEVALEVKRA